MPRKPKTIRMSENEIDWLKRNGREVSAQWRRDLSQFRRLIRMATSHPHIPIGEALQLVEHPDEKILTGE